MTTIRKEHKFQIADLIGLVLFFALFAVIARADLRVLIPLTLAIPALLISLAALLYNRARSWPNGPEQRRSLFAAEIMVCSLLLALLSIASGVFITFFISFFLREDVFFKGLVPHVKDIDDWLRQTKWWIWLYLVPCYIFLGSYVAFAQGLRITIRRNFYIAGGRTLKSLLRAME